MDVQRCGFRRLHGDGAPRRRGHRLRGCARHDDHRGTHPRRDRHRRGRQPARRLGHLQRRAAADVHDHADGRAPRQHQPGHPADGRLRRQPGVQHHAGHRLPRRRRAGRRRVGRRGHELHLHQRDRRPHDQRHVRDHDLHDHADGRAPRQPSARPTPQTVDYGGSRAFTITPAAGYHVADVLVDGVVGRRRSRATRSPTSPPTTRSAPRSRSTRFTITPTAGLNGSISPAAPQTVDYGGEPDLHDHAGHRLPRRRRAGRRRLGRRRHELHVHQRDRRPHDQRHVRDRHVHDHADGRAHGAISPADAADGRLRREPDVHDHAATPATTSPTSPSTASRSAR